MTVKSVCQGCHRSEARPTLLHMNKQGVHRGYPLGWFQPNESTPGGIPTLSSSKTHKIHLHISLTMPVKSSSL